MLRDMEELLNLVCDLEIKDYMREALNCYNSGSYKACVIMSVIAGIYDLNKKVEVLASSNEAIRKLKDNVKKKKDNLKPYEKYLIEKCETAEIDMLNSNEKKELIRCLDTRNDCAHPSNFICSAEKARDIYSSIIDIICSKPALYGCNKINEIVEELNEQTFFPVLENERVEEIVRDYINRFHSKAILPLLKKVVETIIKNENSTKNENAIYFLAISEKCISNFPESYLKEFLKEKNEKYLLQLLGINSDILKYFSDTDIERIIKRFENYLKSEKINNLDNWIKILLSEKLRKDNYINEVLIKLFNEENKIIIVIDVFKKLLDSAKNDMELKDFVLTELKKNYNRVFNEKNICEKNTLEFIKLIDNDEVYEQWLSKIIDYFGGTTSFYKQNDIIEWSFRKIPEELWIKKVSENIKIRLVKIILDNTNPKYGNCSYNARNLMENFQDEYPKLIGEFLEQLLRRGDKNELKKYEWFIKLLKKSKIKDEIEEKIKIIKEETMDIVSSEEDFDFDIE